MSRSEAVKELRASAASWRALADTEPMKARAFREWAGVLESRARSLEWELLSCSA